jgi:hypothetical protein
VIILQAACPTGLFSLISRAKKSLLRSVRTGSGTKWISGVKWPVLEYDHLFLSSAVVENGWGYISIPPDAFMEWFVTVFT